MTVGIKVNKKIITVPSGAVKYVIDNLFRDTKRIKEARDYLSKQHLNELSHYNELGYVDFDNLTPKGMPTIIGDFYKKTTFGLKLTGKWKGLLKKLRI